MVEQQHPAVTTLKCVRTRHVEQMHGKDIRIYEELNSQNQKQRSVSESMDQTLNAKMMDENNEFFKHDTEFHEFRTAVAAGTDLQHVRMANEVTESSPRPSGKASSSTSRSLTCSIRTTHFSQ